MKFLAIDLGTSFLKGAVVDLDALKLRQIHRVPFPDPLPGRPSMLVEYDPAKVLDRVRELVDLLAREGDACAGILMSTQMGSLVLTDRDGKALTPLISWRDQRANLPHPSGQGSYFEVLLRGVDPEHLRQAGSEIRPGLPISFLFWLKEEGQLPGATDAAPVSAGDFIVSNLCGVPPCTNATMASQHGVFNCESLEWHHALIAEFGLDSLRWPALRSVGQAVGSLQLGSREIPCYTPTGDHQCSVAGSFLDFEELSINISTGSQVALLSRELEFGDYQMRPYFDERWLKTITNIPAGRSLSALVDLLCEIPRAQNVELDDPWSYVTKALAEVGDTDLDVNLCFFRGPLGERGGISNIHEHNLTVGHLFRAALENMTASYDTCVRRLSPDKKWKNLVFSGGLAQKFDLLRSFINEKLQADYRLCRSSEDALLGLMAQALVVSGQVPSIEEATTLLREKYEE